MVVVAAEEALLLLLLLLPRLLCFADGNVYFCFRCFGRGCSEPEILNVSPA